RNVVAERRAVKVGWHLESHDRAGHGIDDDTMKCRNNGITRQRVLPGLEFRMADSRIDEIHLPDVAFVLLERRNLSRVGRPADNGPVASRPAGVVGRVTEILDAVLRQLHLVIRRNVTHPQIPIANERRFFTIWRGYAKASG